MPRAISADLHDLAALMYGSPRIPERGFLHAKANDADGLADRPGKRAAGPHGALRPQSGRTFSACGPFCPWVVSNSTFWFSSSDL